MSNSVGKIDIPAMRSAAPAAARAINAEMLFFTVISPNIPPRFRLTYQYNALC